MVNLKGVNGQEDKNYPSDDTLRDWLLNQAKHALTAQEKIHRLKLEFDLDIGKTTFFRLQKRLGIPTVRNPGFTPDEGHKAVITEVESDINQARGPRAVKENLKNNLILISRDKIRQIMWEHSPAGAACRFPGTRRAIIRQPLTSAGPFREISADGHEKLNQQGLCMGDLSVPIYAYRDKWSGCILKLCPIPNSRKPAAIGHLYLDLVEEWEGIPVQLTTDKGSEIGWQTTVQSLLREIYAPNLDPDVFPPSVALRSVHNTVIESLWRWLREKVGYNLKDMIMRGKIKFFFHAHVPQHHDLFYWVFIPLIQQELNKFVDYWNNKKIRKQVNKLMLSNHIPADALRHPSLHGGKQCMIRIPADAQTEMRKILSEEVGPREEHLSWYSEDFSSSALAAFQAIGSPPISFDNGWEVFNSISHVLRLI